MAVEFGREGACVLPLFIAGVKVYGLSPPRLRFVLAMYIIAVACLMGSCWFRFSRTVVEDFNSAVIVETAWKSKPTTIKCSDKNRY